MNASLPRAPALVVRIEAPDASLDAAVAQARALLDRLRQGAIDEADRARATAVVVHARAVADLDPRTRAIGLWRGDSAPPGPPSLESLRAFAAATLRDEALVIVAARPPRGVEPHGHSPPGRPR